MKHNIIVFSIIVFALGVSLMLSGLFSAGKLIKRATVFEDKVAVCVVAETDRIAVKDYCEAKVRLERTND